MIALSLTEGMKLVEGFSAVQRPLGTWNSEAKKKRICYPAVRGRRCELVVWSCQPSSPDPELLDKIAEALFIRRAAEWNISPRQAKVLFYRQKEQGTLRYFALTRLATDVLTALRDMGYSVAANSRG